MISRALGYRHVILRSSTHTRGFAVRQKLRVPNPSGNVSKISAIFWCRWASSVTPNSSTRDPAETEALLTLEEGTQKLEEGDVEGARELYQRSVDIKRNASNLFNLGVTKYHAKDFDGAIENWKESIQLQSDSPDAHTNLASAYIMNPIPKPQLALQHLRIAVQLAPQDPEIAFNLAAVLEACGELEESLKCYTSSKDRGVDRAAVHIRNVSAKILGQRAKAQAASESHSKGKSE